MAVFFGGTLGATLGMLLLCYFIYRVGPKKLPITLSLQALVSGLLTFYLSTDHDGLHYRQVDVAANWAGWFLALAIMALFLVKRSSHHSEAP